MQDNTKVIEEALYHGFRHDVDQFAFPLIKQEASETGTFQHITYKGVIVGFLCVVDTYIEGIYVTPRYRRKGLARKAILEYVLEGGIVERLHIVKTNEAAMKFWHSIFNLRVIDENFCDYLYYIEGIKDDE